VSTPDKQDPARAWVRAEDLLAQEEAERIEKLSGEELRAEMRKDGIDAARVPSGQELIERAMARAATQRAPVAPAVTPMRRRPSRVVWLLAAALGVPIVAIAVLAYVRRPGNLASGVPWPTPREMAEKLRDEAVENCAEGAWAACRGRLDEAARLDPGGESEERVQKARGEIAKAGQ
jgi:hypothetical protein